MKSIPEFPGLIVPAGGFGAIDVDPPWRYKVFSKKGEGRSAEMHYKTWTLEQIAALPIGRIAHKDSFVFLWTTGPNLKNAFDILDAWGFAFSSMAFVWIKLNPRAPLLFFDKHSFHVGMGHTTRKNAEYCLLGRRGKPKRLSRSVRELIISPRREHSRKPPETIERIQTFCAGPYLELFSRESHSGWTAWGNEVGKFDGVKK